MFRESIGIEASLSFLDAALQAEGVGREEGGGRMIEELLDAHPRLTREGILAAIRLGAEVLRADVSYPLCKSVA